MKKDNAVLTTIIVSIVTVALFGGGLFLIGYNNSHDSFKKNKEDVFSELSYKLPNGFKESDYDTIRFVSYDSNSAYFDLDISEERKDYYESAEDCLKRNVYFSLEDEVGELKEEEINGIKMVTLEAKKKYGDEYYYVMESTNHFYMFKFNIIDYKDGDREDIDSNPCFTARNKILYSIKLK